MSIRSLLAVALLVAPFTAHAAVDCTAREPQLAHVCAGGTNDENGGRRHADDHTVRAYSQTRIWPPLPAPKVP